MILRRRFNRFGNDQNAYAHWNKHTFNSIIIISAALVFLAYVSGPFYQ